MHNNKTDKFNIKGLKIAKTFENIERWSLNNRNEKIKDIKNEIKKIKDNGKNKIFKESLEKILLSEEKTLDINYDSKNNYSFNFDVFGDNKSKKQNSNNINKIPHPFNKNNNLFSYNLYNISNKEININYSTNENENIYYLEKYKDILEDRENFEFNMHLYIKDLRNYLTEFKNNLKDLYNKEEKIEVLNNENERRRKSAISTLFQFTPKKKEKEKEKILKRKDKINILNYQLTDNISIHNCKDNFNHITNYNNNTVNQEIYKFNKSKIRIVEKEIQKTEKILLKCIKSITNYYLNILKKSTDIRKDGMTWTIKRLLRLNYMPKITEFPEYIDEKVYYYILKISKLRNELYDLLKELDERKKELLKDKEFIFLQKKIKEIYEAYDINKSSCFDIDKKNLFDKKRYYSADNKKRTNIEKNINDNKKNTYLENKYNKYTNDFFYFKLPDSIQFLLYLLCNDIKSEKKLSKKNNKESNLRNLSFNKETKIINRMKRKKDLLPNKREVYSKKIKIKNQFIKLNEKQKWNKETFIKRESVYESLTNFKKRRNLLNISQITYEKIEKYIMLRMKINEINSNIKKEIKDIENYLGDKKDAKSSDKIYKFIFGNKIQ